MAENMWGNCTGNSDFMKQSYKQINICFNDGSDSVSLIDGFTYTDQVYKIIFTLTFVWEIFYK